MSTHFNRFNHGDGDFVTPGMQLRRIAEEKPTEVAITAISRDGTLSKITWLQLHERSNQLAWLLSSRGVKEKSHVVVTFPNNIMHVLCALAVWKLGACYTPVSSKVPTEELRRICGVLSPDAVLSDIELPAEICCLAESDLTELLEGYPREMPEGVIADPGTAFMSGGSTSAPKIIQNNYPVGYTDMSLQAWFGMSGQAFEQRQIVVGPIFHGAPNNFLFNGLYIGNSIVLPERFSADKLVELIEKYQVEFVQMVPTTMYRILKLDSFRKEQVSSLKALAHTGGMCPSWLKQAWIDILRPEAVYEIFSCTEGIGVTTIRGDEWLKHRGSVGRPIDSDIRICGNDGEGLPVGEIGVIYMRKKYGGLPTEYIGHKQIDMTEDGYRTVGDMGFLDAEGYLYYVDRRSDMIVTGGENVFAADVESALMQLPDVLDAAVIGVPDEEWGRVVMAIIEQKPGVCLTEDMVSDALRSMLLPYQVPKRYEFTEHIPRMESGKINRGQLIASYTGQ